MAIDTFTLTARSLKKWFRNPAVSMPALFMAIFWLALFGSSFNPANLVPTQVEGADLSPVLSGQVKATISAMFSGAPNYITFLTSGVIALIIIINMAYGGIEIVLDRELGFLSSLLSSPISRASIFLSGVLQNFVKAMLLAALTFVIALLLPNGLQVGAGFGMLNLLGLLAVFGLLTFGLGCIFTALALFMRSVGSLVAIVNFLAFPLIFMSSAIFPLGTFPSWLRGVAQVNPITKAVETGRMLIVNGALSSGELSTLAFNALYLAVFALVLALIGYFLAQKALKPK